MRYVPDSMQRSYDHLVHETKVPPDIRLTQDEQPIVHKENTLAVWIKTPRLTPGTAGFRTILRKELPSVSMAGGVTRTITCFEFSIDGIKYGGGDAVADSAGVCRRPAWLRGECGRCLLRGRGESRMALRMPGRVHLHRAGMLRSAATQVLHIDAPADTSAAALIAGFGA